MYTETIRTERLILRRFRPEDALQLHENCSSDAAVIRYLEREACTDPKATESLVNSWIERYEGEDFFLWAVEFEGAVIGSVNLHDVCRAEGRCEIGFSIGSAWWNRGIMTEAAGAVVRHALDRLGFERITGWCAAGNAASARVMEKIGMKRGVRMPDAVQLSGGEWADKILYSLEKEEIK